MQIAIIGLGLMGGSLGLALRRRDDVRVTAYARRAVTRELALELGAADAVFDTPSAAVQGADIVVLCVPVLTLEPLLRECLPALKSGCVVTDVGSTKTAVAEAATAALEGHDAVFVGSHPICGSEETGLEAACADLYEAANVVITPCDRSPDMAVARIQAFWMMLGARVSTMDAATHDRVLARTSHLPHLVAAVLAGSVCRDDLDVGPMCGGGFRDTTRIAAGSEDVWHDIVETNHAAICHELDAFAERLEGLRTLIKAGEFEVVRATLAEYRARRNAALAKGTKDHE